MWRWWSEQFKPYKVLLEWTGNVHFCTICEITLVVCGPGKVRKNGCNFLYES